MVQTQQDRASLLQELLFVPGRRGRKKQLYLCVHAFLHVQTENRADLVTARSAAPTRERYFPLAESTALPNDLNWTLPEASRVREPGNSAKATKEERHIKPPPRWLGWCQTGFHLRWMMIMEPRRHRLIVATLLSLRAASNVKILLLSREEDLGTLNFGSFHSSGLIQKNQTVLSNPEPRLLQL